MAGSLLEDLNEAVAVALTDLLYVVVDPATLPADRKLQVGNLPFILAAAAGAAGGVATLDGAGQVPAVQIPAVAISNWLGDAASQAEMLALGPGQRGDWCTRTDTNTTWILIGDDSTQLADWKMMLSPTDAVTSVDGQTGAVSLAASYATVTALASEIALARNADNLTSGTVPTARLPAASTTAQGAVERADATELAAGTATDRFPAVADLPGVWLGTVTLGAPAASIGFSPIPEGWSSLRIIGQLRSDRAGSVSDGGSVSFNGDTTDANYEHQVLQATNGTVQGALTISNRVLIAATGAAATADQFGIADVTIPAYATANNRKKALCTTFRDETVLAAAFIAMRGMLWKNTAPITSVSFAPSVGTNFVAGSFLSLYGVR